MPLILGRKAFLTKHPMCVLFTPQLVSGVLTRLEPAFLCPCPFLPFPGPDLLLTLFLGLPLFPITLLYLGAVFSLNPLGNGSAYLPMSSEQNRHKPE